MSILIKGVEMPKGCYDCMLCRLHPIQRELRFCCEVINRAFEASEESEMEKKRLFDCPLVEVPVPHGDLIDIDSKITIGVKDGLKVTTVRDLLNDKAVRLPKTVIEAEGTNEGSN